MLAAQQRVGQSPADRSENTHDEVAAMTVAPVIVMITSGLGRVCMEKATSPTHDMIIAVPSSVEPTADDAVNAEVPSTRRAPARLPAYGSGVRRARSIPRR
ncbi:hypothetical protein [Streptosporangium sp. NPDC003464]